MTPTRQSQGAVRYNTTDNRATATLLSADYGGLTTYTLEYGPDAIEEAGGDPLAVENVSDEFETGTGSLTLLDTDANAAAVAGLTGRRGFLWIAKTGTAAGQNPANEEESFECSFTNSSHEITVPNGGVFTLPFNIAGKVTVTPL